MMLTGIGFILSIFGCVVLHELGHALAARRYNIPTKDITLLPIGGVARLERMPEDPKQELWVALAGPAVNVVIATILFILIQLWIDISTIYEIKLTEGIFLVNLMWVNVILVIFNLLPAFPMDGGRVLRALLAYRYEYVRATQIAASIGQFMAILFGIWGLFSNPFLLFIAIFVYLGAGEEAHMVQMKSIFKGVPVRQAMVTRFETLQEHDTVATAVEKLIAGSQHDFPVIDHDMIVGVVTRHDLLRALAEKDQQTPISQIMQRNCPVIDEKEMLESTFQKMRQGNIPTLPVVRGNQLIGLITLENLGEWMMVQSALRKTKARHEIEDIFNVK